MPPGSCLSGLGVLLWPRWVDPCPQGLSIRQTRRRAGGKGVPGTVSLGGCGQQPGLPGSLTPYGFCLVGETLPHIGVLTSCCLWVWG